MVLVIAPTRELALQVHAELSWLYEFARGRVISCVGGMDARREARALSAGCHIVVGTPGRLQDHINRGNLHLDELEVVILDEADEMLDLGFKDELEFILSTAPESRRTLLFSATIAKDIATLARQYQQNALRIDTVSRNQPHADIEYRAIRVAGHETRSRARQPAAPVRNPAPSSSAPRATRCATCMPACWRAASMPWLSPANFRRTNATPRCNALRDGRAQICIATDVAARGLDLPDLDLVIHADLPTNKATLLHRSGRTGRAGRKGLCLLLVPPSKRRRAELLLGSGQYRRHLARPAHPGRNPRARPGAPARRPAAHANPHRGRADPGAKPCWRANHPRQSPPRSSALPAPICPNLPMSPFCRPPPSHAHSAERESSTPRTSTAYVPSNQPGAWFRMPIGRKHNADPKWMIPLICKAGNVTKQEIGAIKIFDRETKFEIASHVVESFQASTAKMRESEPRIEPTAPPMPGRTPYAGTPPAKRPPADKRPYTEKSGKPSEQQRRRQNKSNRAPG